MTPFVILTAAPEVIDAIQKVYATDFYKYTDTQWFVADEGVTAQEVHRKLSATPADAIPANPPKPAPTVVVCTVAGYYGVARKDLWEWLAAKGNAPKQHGTST